ncbi:Dus-domain-containing protein [Calocera viscosa TUFC12733]|uniref:tRNA-dihydrouridine(16/17) synthase [NAD(P)(+)] n=1 Tax=Calocera viscosa (strain TUFC12733) TaxID=1330018 RepID=A0A167H4Z2_CALVF|nr:Dus-domain-containing protein [Calocera viscosa TUFC12733]
MTDFRLPTPSGSGSAPRRKLGGYEFYREVLGSPKLIVAPMVDQSELPWRILSRRYGAQLVYTPMINAKTFANHKNADKFRRRVFDMVHGEEGGPEDRPLIVQFCANDPEALLEAARVVQPFCDAVDLNLGCPQDIAKKGRYGAFLQDDWELVYSLINILHENLDIPVTAKFRVFPSVERTVEYAQMIERAGAQILTCHGRTREQRGHNSGLADWAKIAAVKRAVRVPVFANGNVLYHEDVGRCLDATGCDGVMTAEGNLYNPALFAGTHPPHCGLALEYLAIAKRLKTRTAPSAIKGHVFKLLRPALEGNKDLRNRIGAISGRGEMESVIEEYEAVVREFKERMERDATAGEEGISELADGKKHVPHWLAQPYFRPPPPAQVVTGATKAPPAQALPKMEGMVGKDRI